MPKSKSVVRYTYASLREPSRKIVLFKDTVQASGSTTSTTVSRNIGSSSNPADCDVIHLSVISAPANSTPEQASPTSACELLAVRRDGSVLCFHGDTLEEQWQTPPALLSRDLAISAGSLQVQHAQVVSGSDISKDFFAGRDGLVGPSRQDPEKDAADTDVIVLVTTSANGKAANFLHMLAVPSHDNGAPNPKQRSLVQLHAVPLPTAASSSTSTFRLDMAAGVLLEQSADTVLCYSVAGSMPKVMHRISVPGVASALRLSASSILTATTESLAIYNPTFQSLQASTPLGVEPRSSQIASPENVAPQSCSLVAYFARLDLVAAIQGSNLLAIQLEPPRTRGKKRKAGGLLIDAIGRGVSRTAPAKDDDLPRDESLKLGAYLPGTPSARYWNRYLEQTQAVTAAFTAKDFSALDRLLADVFGIESKPGQDTEPPEWVWPNSPADYSQVDRRWILFVLSRLFVFSQVESGGDNGSRRLSCVLPPCNIVTYLVTAGHLSVSNVESALKEALRDADEARSMIALDLPGLLAELDPTMQLLLAWLQSTSLETTELLTAIRHLMRSLELIQDPSELKPKLLTYRSMGVYDQDAATGDEADDGVVDMELDLLEQELEVMEHHLGDETGIRARALSTAFGKLGGCSASYTTKALRRFFRPEEILSLIYVLRMELVKDGWTSRYLDTTRLDRDDELEAPPDGSIHLIADLLCRCIDSVGAGGWLINDALLAAQPGDHLDSADFLASLKLEVSAALEGVEEAVYLRGLLGETVRFGQVVHAARKAAADNKEVLRTVQKPEVASQLLPVGLKLSGGEVSDVSRTKVVAGRGEVVTRSKREVKYLESMKVGAYTLERIAL